MSTNIQHIKIELIQWLTKVEDPDLIQKILELKESESGDFWDEISYEEKKSVQKGVAEAEDGKLKPRSEARKVYEKWL